MARGLERRQPKGAIAGTFLQMLYLASVLTNLAPEVTVNATSIAAIATFDSDLAGGRYLRSTVCWKKKEWGVMASVYYNR